MDSAQQAGGLLAAPGPPGLLLALPPGGFIGPEERLSCIEIKVGPGIVVQIEPGSVLLGDAGPVDLAAFDHLTVHADLSCHVRGRRGRLSLAGPRTTRLGALPCPTVHLVSVGAGSVERSQPYKPRHQQRTFSGGSVILPALQDALYQPGRTQLVVDVWAVRAGTQEPIPPTFRGARLAAANTSNLVVGPMPASWAFRGSRPPECELLFTFWLAEVPASEGRPFVRCLNP